MTSTAMATSPAKWGGAANVFAALDTDGDGRISPSELGAGLGGAFVLSK
jgi:hypothetical protein